MLPSALVVKKTSLYYSTMSHKSVRTYPNTMSKKSTHPLNTAAEKTSRSCRVIKPINLSRSLLCNQSAPGPRGAFSTRRYNNDDHSPSAIQEIKKEEKVHIWPKYPLMPHARTNDLRRELLAAYSDESQYYRMPKIAEEYLAKHPASGMGDYEKKRFNEALEILISAMVRDQISWGLWGGFFLLLIDHLRCLRIKTEHDDPVDKQVKKEQ